MGHNGHHWKDLWRINNVENIRKKESSYHLGGNVNGEATLKNGMEVPWNTKRRGIIWSCNLIPGLGFRKKCSFKMTRAPWYSGQHYLQQPRQNPPKCPLTEVWRLCGTLYTGMRLSHKAQRNADIGSGMDEPRNCNSMWGKSERETNMWRVQVEYINSYQWTNVPNRPTAWENQIPIIKRKLEESLGWKYTH